MEIDPKSGMEFIKNASCDILSSKNVITTCLQMHILKT